MSLRDDLQAELVEVQRKLTILNSVSEDTFTFGTVMVFSAANGSKWHYVKIAEELWKKMTTGGNQKSLSEWVFDTVESNIGYFEVYELRVQPTPFYASS